MGSLGETRYVDSFISYVAGQAGDYYGGTVGHYRQPADPRSMRVHDMRDISTQLDIQGFQLITDIQSKHDFSDKDYITTQVYAETQDIIRRATGAAKVHCYSHLVRDTPPEAVRALVEDKDVSDDATTSGLRVPSPMAHIDHSAAGSLEVVRDNLSAEDAARLQASGKRWAIVNLWRPIKPVQRDPLCVCDARTVEEGDLMEQTVFLTGNFASVSKGSSFKSLAVSANPRHKWYYVSDMQPDECLLIKIFDTQSGKAGISGGVPHTSFHLPGTEEYEARNSIEMRCLVFYD